MFAVWLLPLCYRALRATLALAESSVGPGLGNALQALAIAISSGCPCEATLHNDAHRLALTYRHLKDKQSQR